MNSKEFKVNFKLIINTDKIPKNILKKYFSYIVDGVLYVSGWENFNNGLFRTLFLEDLNGNNSKFMYLNNEYIIAIYAIDETVMTLISNEGKIFVNN